MKKHLEKIEKLINNNYWTNWLGISRSILAFSLLLTLCLNHTTTLFYTGLQNENYPKFNSLQFNLYSWFTNLEKGVIASIIILIFVIIGLYPKYTCIPHWFIVYSFSITSTCSDGGDQVASIITLLLIPICIFDKRKWHWSKIKTEKSFFAKTISTLSYYLISLQIFIIYFFAAMGKLKVDEWQNGTAIYYWLTHPLFGANSFLNPFICSIIKYPILTAFLNWSVILLELVIAFCIFSTNITYKKIILIIGLFFHFFILLFMGIVTFSITMTAILILFLISKNNNYDTRNFNFNSIIKRINNRFLFSTQKN